MVGELVTVVLNDVTVVDRARLGNYVSRIASQKPRKEGALIDPNDFPDPVRLRGPIQLQSHGSEIRWRNVFIREIGSDEANAWPAADEQGFLRLDNGRDLSNWQGAVDSYEVRDGCIVCKPGCGGDLLSREEFGDMILRFEFRLPPAGNSGIAIRTPPSGRSASEGLEIQVLDDEGYIAKTGRPLKDYQYHGSICHCVGAKRGYLRPAGQWNTQEIRVEGQRVRVTLNGTRILDADLDKVDRSKLSVVPKGLERRSGHIGFAGHNDPVEFQNVRVKRLP